MLKVVFHLQLLQNIGYIPPVEQYILEPILYPINCAFLSTPTPQYSPSALVTMTLFSISEFASFLFIH